MTLEELRNKVTIGLWGECSVTIDYKGQKYTSLTFDYSAYYRVKLSGFWADREHNESFTLKQAYQRLWDDCKVSNGLI